LTTRNQTSPIIKEKEVQSFFNREVVIKSVPFRPLPDPGPLGLFGFGLTTFLLNMHNAGVWEQFDAMILSMGLIFGGFAQLLAGILEFTKNNQFGMLAFISYGCFWISLCITHYAPGLVGAHPSTPMAMAWYLFIWGVFSLIMFITICKRKKAFHFMQWVFFCVVWLFWLLAIENWCKAGGSDSAAKIFQIIAGVEGIICGLSAIYLGAAGMVNGDRTTWLPVEIPMSSITNCFSRKKLKSQEEKHTELTDVNPAQ
jgi:succinate-acetate transporter protein